MEQRVKSCARRLHSNWRDLVSRGQSLPWGRRFTSASEGQEFHLHESQVIKDFIGLRSSSLTARVISRKRITLTRAVKRLS